MGFPFRCRARSLPTSLVPLAKGAVMTDSLTVALRVMSEGLTSTMAASASQSEKSKPGVLMSLSQRSSRTNLASLVLGCLKVVLRNSMSAANALVASRGTSVMGTPDWNTTWADCGSE